MYIHVFRYTVCVCAKATTVEQPTSHLRDWRDRWPSMKYSGMPRTVFGEIWDWTAPEKIKPSMLLPWPHWCGSAASRELTEKRKFYLHSSLWGFWTTPGEFRPPSGSRTLPSSGIFPTPGPRCSGCWWPGGITRQTRSWGRLRRKWPKRGWPPLTWPGETSTTPCLRR